MSARWMILAFLLFLAGLPLAAHADDLDDCNGSDLDRVVRGCSSIIEAGTVTTQNLAIAHNNRGSAYLNKGDYDSAIKDFDQAIALDPKYVFTYYNRGNAYRRKGDQDSAIKDYDKAIALDPKLAPPYNNRGSAHLDKGDYDRAIKDFDQAIALDPKYVFAYNNRGMAYNKKGKIDRAIKDYDRAIALDPKYMFAYNNRGLAYYNKGKLDRAIKDYDRASALNPEFVDGHVWRCWVRAIQGSELKTARDACNTALSLAKDAPNIFSSRGMVGLKQKQFKNAWADYSAAVKAEPKEAAYLYGRGIAALRLGRTKEGKADLARALKLNPNIAKIYKSYGVTP